MLQKSLLFSHPADEDRNYSEVLELNSSIIFNFAVYSAVTTTCILISILGLIGNGIILWLLCCTTKKTKFTIYIANLAIADFLVLLHSLIVNLDLYNPGFINIPVNQLVLILGFFGFETNAYFLAAVSTERCLTVFSPVWYQYHRKKHFTPLVCTLLWTLSVTLKLFHHFLCSRKYISVLNIGITLCKAESVFTDIIIYIIAIFLMVFSTLALCIRMKRKPQQDFPATFDITIWIIVVLYLIFCPATEIIARISFSSPSFSYRLESMYVEKIFYCMASFVNPFVYLLVGCWKWKKGQEPFYMFLERALKDNRKGSTRSQPDQEQA